jgi:glutamyl/glutaminyl-tRNA synthetase
MSDEKYLEFVKPFVNVDLSFTGEKDLALLTFKKQIAYASQLNDLIKEYFIDINFDSVDKILETNGVSKENYEKCSSAFLGIAKEFGKITPENTKEIINKVKETTGLKGKDLFMPIRVCVIAKEHGPEMDKILPVMSKKILS